MNISDSDGCHTFDELYEHRSLLFISLMKAHPHLSWRANIHHDGTHYSDYFIAGMELPSGQITYHLKNEFWEMLDYSMIATSNKAPKWDGHTSDDVIKRISNWIRQQNVACKPLKKH
jgi:hypothetical protein